MTSLPARLVAHAVAFLALAALFASAPAGAGEDRFVDRSLGFSFSVPSFPPSDERGATTVLVTLSGAPEGPFAPNVNLVVHNVGTTLETYRREQRREIESVGWSVVEQDLASIGGRPALRTHARGSAQDVAVEFLSVAMIADGGDEKIFVLTCTASSQEFPRHRAEFERVIASLALSPPVGQDGMQGLSGGTAR